MSDQHQKQLSTIRAAFALSVTQWTCFAVEVSLLAYIAKDVGLDDVRIGYLSTTTALAQLVTSPFFSRWAGSHLKYAVTIAFLSSSLSYLLTALSHSFGLLFVSRLASAFGHGAVAAQTAIAASTKPEERTAAFGKLGATFGIGFIVGSAVGGMSAKALGLRIPIFGASLICAMAALIGPKFIEIRAQNPEKKDDDRGNSQGLKGYLRLLESRKVVTILGAKTLSITPATVMLSIFGIYLINEFGIDPGANAILTIYIGLCMTAMNAGGVSFLRKHSGDRGLLLGGVASFAVTGLGLIFAKNYYHFFPVMTALAVGMALTGSSTDSMLTASVQERDHALVLGLAWAVDSLTRVVGPTLAGYMLSDLGFESFGFMQILGSLTALVLVYVAI